MSGLRWKMRRLLAMSPSEIAVRAARAARDRLSPLPKESPHETAERLLRRPAIEIVREQAQRLPNDFSALSSESLARLVQEADALLEGRWRFFGYDVQFDNPPNWRKNYASGQEWPDQSAKTLDYRRIDLAGGVKYVWEPSRGGPLVRLAQAYAVTGDEKYAQTCATWFENWIQTNPRGHGIHWTSALEHGIRAFAWLYAWAWISRSNVAIDHESIAGALLQHGEFIDRHLSVGSSANNHVLGEAAALAFLAERLPSQMSEAWRARGMSILQSEIARQFYEDGVNAEQAFGYLPFVWEFCLHARAWEGDQTVRDRLVKNLAFARNVMDESGYVPQLGDEDDGSIVPCWPIGSNRHIVVGRALAQALGEEPPPALDPTHDELCVMLTGQAPSGGSLLKERAVYRQGGLVSLRGGDGLLYALFDCGPLGLGSIAAHGHADALSIAMSIGGKPCLIDSGTYAYHEDPDWRNHFRSTAAHNTVQVNDTDQSQNLGAFLWGKRAETSLVDCNDDTTDVVAVHDGYSPIMHQRGVRWEPNSLTVEDAIMSKQGAQAAKLMWRWHFHPDWQVSAIDEQSVRATSENCALTVRVDGDRLPAIAIEEGWYSPQFGQKVRCSVAVLTIPVASLPVKAIWRFDASLVL
ncbi:MAG: alginate lyase family protein [Armatimonadetes bacterium]|nr:alginate lyase family protein [Armatimonadota bacterium]